jgi:outer membrane protein assembly factor BamB
MLIRKVLLCLLTWLTACAPASEQVDDHRQHVQLLWRNPSLGWITSSLLIQDNLLYFGSFNHFFGSAELSTGKLKLVFKTGDDPYYQPVLAKGRVYFSSFDLQVYCLDSLGKLVWKRQTADRVKSKLLEQAGTLYIPVRHDGLWAVNALDGKAKWHLPQPGIYSSINQPLLRAGKLYVGQWGLADSILAVNASTGKIAWATSYPDYASSDPIAAPQGLLVCTDKYYKGGKVKLLRYTTGEEIWSTDLKCEALYQPLMLDNQVIVPTYDEQVVCLSTSTGKILWATKLQPGEEVASQFCRFQHGIYFGTTTRNLYCLDSQTGKIRFKEAFNYGISDPLVANGKLYIPTGGSELWGLKE